LSADSFQSLLGGDPERAMGLVQPLIVTMSSRLRKTSSALCRMGEACAGAMTWEELAAAVVRALRIAIPSTDRAVFVRYNPFAEEEEELAASAPEDPTAGQPASRLTARAAEATTLAVESAGQNQFTPDEEAWLITAATWVSAAATRMAQSADAEGLARLKARRIQ